MTVEEAWGKVCSEVRLLKEMHEHYNFPSHLEEQEKRIDAARAAYDKAVIAEFVTNPSRVTDDLDRLDVLISAVESPEPPKETPDVQPS